VLVGWREGGKEDGRLERHLTSSGLSVANISSIVSRHRHHHHRRHRVVVLVVLAVVVLWVWVGV